MPFNDRCRLDQHHHFQTARPQSVEPDPQEPIYGDESPTARMLAMQDRHLVTQRDDLKFQFHAAPKPTSEPREECRDVCEHARDTTAVILKTLDIPALSEFSVGTAEVLAWSVANSPAPPAAIATRFVSLPRPVYSATIKRGAERIQQRLKGRNSGGPLAVEELLAAFGAKGVRIQTFRQIPP